MIRGPNWRTRAEPSQRHRAAIVTVGLVVAWGSVVLGVVMWLLDRAGAPTWLVILPWLAPTIVAVAWALFHPMVAVVTDSDDDSWVGYAIQYVVVGEDHPRVAPARLVAAALVGAPAAWSIGLFGLSAMAGLF